MGHHANTGGFPNTYRVHSGPRKFAGGLSSPPWVSRVHPGPHESSRGLSSPLRARSARQDTSFVYHEICAMRAYSGTPNKNALVHSGGPGLSMPQGVVSVTPASGLCAPAKVRPVHRRFQRMRLRRPRPQRSRRDQYIGASGAFARSVPPRGPAYWSCGVIGTCFAGAAPAGATAREAIPTGTAMLPG